MRVPVELDPDVDDAAPTGDTITVYDERHFVTYLRLLDAKAEGADWKEVARIVLHRDPVAEELRTRRCWQSPELAGGTGAGTTRRSRDPPRARSSKAER